MSSCTFLLFCFSAMIMMSREEIMYVMRKKIYSSVTLRIIRYNTLQTTKCWYLILLVEHWQEGRILETLIHLILPVRRVDKSKAEWDEDNKVRQWTGVTPLHLSLCLFPISLCLCCIILSPLLSHHLSFFVSFLPLLQCRHICSVLSPTTIVQ